MSLCASEYMWSSTPPRFGRKKSETRRTLCAGDVASSARHLGPGTPHVDPRSHHPRPVAGPAGTPVAGSASHSHPRDPPPAGFEPALVLPRARVLPVPLSSVLTRVSLPPVLSSDVSPNSATCVFAYTRAMIGRGGLRNGNASATPSLRRAGFDPPTSPSPDGRRSVPPLTSPTPFLVTKHR